MKIRRTIAVALALTSSVRAQTGLTVAAAADAALRNYPSIRVSAEQVNAAAAGIQLARTACLPRVEALAARSGQPSECGCKATGRAGRHRSRQGSSGARKAI